MDEDDIYFPPHFVASLTDVPPEWQADYEPYREGPKAFILRAPMWAMVCDMKQKIGDVQKQQADLKQKYETDVVAEANITKSERVARGLSAALVAAGVKPGLVSGAIALLRDTHEFEVERAHDDSGYVILAHSGGMLLSVENVVESFFDTENGQAFQPRERAAKLAADNRFSNWVQELKRGR